MLHVHLWFHFLQYGKVKRSYYFLPSRKPLESDFNPLKPANRKRCDIDDSCVRDSQLSTHADFSLVDSHASEEPTTKVEELSPNKEENNTKQHKPENEDRHLLKLKLNEMVDQRFLNFMYRKLST